MDDDKVVKNLPASVDMDPSESQTLSGLQEDSPEKCEIESVLGILPSIAPHLPKKKDAQLIETLNKELYQHNIKNHTNINPLVSVVLYIVRTTLVNIMYFSKMN